MQTGRINAYQLAFKSEMRSCTLFLVGFVVNALPGQVTAQQFPFTFVRALGLEVGYRETHASACTRMGMLMTQQDVVLSFNQSVGTTWDMSAFVQALSTIGDVSAANPAAQSCCSASLFCHSSSSTCWTTGFGGMFYQNHGWTSNDTWVPVYTCLNGTKPAVPFTGRAARRSGALVIDGNNLGVITKDLSATVDGQPCSSVEVCSNICAACRSSSACGDDKVCVGSGTMGNCLRPCQPGKSCPCGTTCASYGTSTPGVFLSLCVDPRSLGDDLCGWRGPWYPPAGSGMRDRIECTPPTGVYGQSLLSTRGTSDTARALRRSLRSLPSPDSSEVRDGTADMLQVQFPAVALSAHSIPDPVPDQTGQPARSDEHVLHGRSLLGMQPGWQSGASRLAPTPLQGGYRYSSVSAGSGGFSRAGVQGAFPVVVMKKGWASTGLGPAAAAAWGVNVTAARYSDDSTVPFASLFPSLNSSAPVGSFPYSQPVPAYVTTTQVCSAGVNTTCLTVDACTSPVCTVAGACEYVPNDSCMTTSVPYEAGEYPTHMTYSPLPAAVAGVVPMVPPPQGGLPYIGPNLALKVSNPMFRTPATNRRAIDWHPGSVWFDPTSIIGAATLVTAPFNTQTGNLYQEQDVSFVDDTPMDPISLTVSSGFVPRDSPAFPTRQPWRFPFYGSAGLNTVSLSPNGYIRAVPTNPCRGSFGGSTCSLDTDYAGVVSPLLADYYPGQYDTSEVTSGQIDGLGFAIAYLNSTAAGPGVVDIVDPATRRLGLSYAEYLSVLSGALASRMLCVTSSEMGLFSYPSTQRYVVPNPSFSTHLCVAGDGSIRWRYGQILGTPGIADGQWNNATVVNTSLGGPPAAHMWFAGVRSLSTAWDYAESQLGPSGYGNTTVGIPQGISLLSAPNSNNFYDATGPGPDVAAPTSQQLLVNSRGVRPGGTAAICALGTVACAKPACGPSGTTVNIRWSGLACGLGFEGLLPSILELSKVGSISGSSPYTPRLQCAFGAQTSPATWTAQISGQIGNVTGGTTGVLSCVAPAPAAGTASVTLRLQMVLPATPAAWARYGPALTWARTDASLESVTGLYAALGVGPSDGSFDDVTGMLTVDVPVHGMVLTSGTNGVTVAAPLVFRYATSGTCGCNAFDAGESSCDSCGTCGGAGRTVDCAGTCFGKAVVDDCGVCSAGTTQRLPNADKDCNGICYGPSWNCEATPTAAPTSAGGDGLTNIILYFFIVGTPLVFCTVGLTWASYWWCYSAAERDRREQMAINALSRDPEAMGIRGGLSDAQLDRIPMKAWRTAAIEFANVPGRTDSGATACPVCMEDFREGDQVRMLPGCSHTGHTGCFDTWLTRSTTCPVCRAELRTPEEVDQDEDYRRNRATAMTRAQQRQAARRVRMLDAARTDVGVDAVPEGIELASVRVADVNRDVNASQETGTPRVTTARGPSPRARQAFMSGSPHATSTGAAAMPVPGPGVSTTAWAPNPYSHAQRQPLEQHGATYEQTETGHTYGTGVPGALTDDDSPTPQRR